MAKVNPKKAKATFEKYLAEIQNLRGVPPEGDGIHFRDQLSEKIRTLIKLSFDDSREKLNNYHPDPQMIRYQGYGKDMKKDERYYHLDKLHRMQEYIVGYIEELDLISDTDTKTDDKEDLKYLEPLEIDTSRDDFSWNIQIFITHKFIRKDQELALTLKSILRKKEIFGYIADKKKEYTLPIDEKIQNSLRESQFLIAIISSESLTSASVNQEIGFALGHDIPVALMIEKGLIPEGVFTKGRDVEEFTRGNFSLHCENVIQYVLEYVEENKNSKKISKPEKEWLQERVYEPCYNMMKNVYDGRHFITGFLANPWDSLTHTLKLKTETDIKDLFEKYSEEVRKWSQMFTDFTTHFIEKRNTCGELLRQIFQKYELLDENGRIHAGTTVNPPEQWLHNCQYVIFNDGIRNEDELFEILKKDATIRYGSEYSEFLDEWKNKNPQIFNDLLLEIPELVKTLGAKYSYAQLEQQRTVLIDLIEKITLALEEKLKK